MNTFLIFYTLISLGVMLQLIGVMFDEDRESVECFNPPSNGYNFRSDTGEFNIPKRTLVSLLAVAPFTNLVFGPLVLWVVFWSDK